MNNCCNKNKFYKVLTILCCAIPLLVIGALYLAKVQGKSWGSILSLGAVLLCPLMHLVMIPLLHREKG